MRMFTGVLVTALALAVPAAAQDADRKVAGGGITAKGWQGSVDAGAAKKGQTINDSKFEEKGGTFSIHAGSPSTYWNPANVAKGDYTVSGTFTEAKMSASHPHPYGIFIGGSDLGTEKPSYAYCVAYGDGTALVRGFSNGQVVNFFKRQPHAAVAKAEAGSPVTQTIAWSVKGDRAECSINGTVVAGFAKADLVGEGKLASSDGIYGIRVAHNVDVVVKGFGKK